MAKINFAGTIEEVVTREEFPPVSYTHLRAHETLI